MLSRRQTLIAGSSLAIVQNVIRILTGLISVPLTLNYLGKERYGLWMVTLSTLSFVNFMDVGLMPTLKNRMSEAFGLAHEERFQAYSSGTIFIGLSLLGIGMVITFLLSFFDWKAIFRVNDLLAQREVLPLVLTVFAVGVTSVATSSVDGIYAARMQMPKIQTYAILASIVAFGMLILGIKLKVGLPLLALSTSGPLVLYRLVLLAELYLEKRELVIPKIYCLSTILRESLPLSFSFLGIKVAEGMLVLLPNLIIVKLLSLSQVTIFGVSTRLATVPLILINAILPVFWPAFTVAWSRGEKTWLRNRLVIVVTVTFLALSVYTVSLAFMGSWLIRWWTQNQILVSFDILIGLGIMVTIQASVYWLSTFLHSISDFHFELLCHSLSVTLLGVSAWFFTKWFGLFGLAIAISASWAIGCLFPMIYRVYRKLSTAS